MFNSTCVCFVRLVCKISTVPIVVGLCYRSFIQLYTDLYISPLTYVYISPQPTVSYRKHIHVHVMTDILLIVQFITCLMSVLVCSCSPSIKLVPAPLLLHVDRKSSILTTQPPSHNTRYTFIKVQYCCNVFTTSVVIKVQHCCSNYVTTVSVSK